MTLRMSHHEACGVCHRAVCSCPTTPTESEAKETEPQGAPPVSHHCKNCGANQFYYAIGGDNFYCRSCHRGAGQDFYAAHYAERNEPRYQAKGDPHKPAHSYAIGAGGSDDGCSACGAGLREPCAVDCVTNQNTAPDPRLAAALANPRDALTNELLPVPINDNKGALVSSGEAAGDRVTHEEAWEQVGITVEPTDYSVRMLRAYIREQQAKQEQAEREAARQLLELQQLYEAFSGSGHSPKNPREAAQAIGQMVEDRDAERAQKEALSADLETLRMRLAGCSTAAIGYHKQGDPIHPDYECAALSDVMRLYTEKEALRAENEGLKERAANEP